MMPGFASTTTNTIHIIKTISLAFFIVIFVYHAIENDIKDNYEEVKSGMFKRI